MDIKTISVALAIVTVSAVIFGALLPMFQDVTATEDTFTNEGYYRMDKITSSDSDTLTILWDHTNPYGVTVNNTFVPINIDGMVSVLADTNFTVRLNKTSTTNMAIQWYSTTGGAFSADVLSGTDMTIICENGTATATRGEDSRTGNYDVLYYPSINGPYVMKGANDVAYMIGDSVIFACGTSQIRKSDGGLIGSQALGVEIDGTIADGVSISVWRDLSDATTINTDSIVLDYSEVSNYQSLYKLSKITFDAIYTETIDDAPVSVNNPITYSYFIVPYEVTAERSVTVDGPTGAVIDLIPLIVALSIVILAVGWFITRKL